MPGADQFEIKAFRNRLGTGSGVQFSEDVVYVILYSGFAQSNHLCDFPVALSAGHPLQDFLFPLGQFCLLCRCPFFETRA